MPVKPAHHIMTEPCTVDPKREFRITGIVRSIQRDMDYTIITVIHTDHHKYDDNMTLFTIMFTRPQAKLFINKYTKLDDLIMCIGQLEMKDGKIILDGNYAMLFRGMESMWDVPGPLYIDPDEIPEADNLAY